MTTTTEDRMTRAMRRNAQAMTVLDAAAALKLAQEDRSAAGLVSEILRDAAKCLIDAALNMEVER